MDAKLLFVGIILLAFFWLITTPRRRRRRAEAEDKIRIKAHNTRRIRYVGFDTSEDEQGRRVVHARHKDGADACSDQCPYCEAGMNNQSKLRVIDDRPIRGWGNRRQMKADREQQ